MRAVDLIQLRARERFLVVGELIGRPAAERVDPAIRRQRRRLRLHHLDRLRARRDVVEAQLVGPQHTFFHVVRVVVDHAGHDRAAGQIDPARRRSGERRDVVVAADGDDAVALDGDGLRDRESLVDGDDLAAGEDRRRPDRSRSCACASDGSARGSLRSGGSGLRVGRGARAAGAREQRADGNRRARSSDSWCSPECGDCTGACRAEAAGEGGRRECSFRRNRLSMAELR